MRTIDVNLPTFGFVVMTRALLGVGIGLLLVGAATTIPAALAVLGGKGPTALSRRGRVRRTTIMNAPSYFEIHADNPRRAVEFYRTMFGWTFARAEGLPIEYWRIETAGPRGGLLQRPVSAPAPEQGTNAFVCSMEVSDFDATAKRITDAGGRVAMPKFAVPGICWQGYFLDPEGNTFGIFQPDASAK